ncbi:hypothetical protein GC722_09705 [Auraticoccus sp. F435]|uniref:Uncharacterized protein n=1 Tax=Auraticoccus cholistanensis TaxID=2656650 RepID=A0A6A9UY08_9ACTN|nr:hypothetical protein [Auraticoccus cholistanensis]MVA76297.1 hypothetical protein [Auraticoccus cholistanensis]
MSDSDASEHDKLMENDQEQGGEQVDLDEPDQDSEPTMTAPDGERPTGTQGS